MAKRKTTKSKTTKSRTTKPKPRAAAKSRTAKPKVARRKTTPQPGPWGRLSEGTRQTIARAAVWTVALVALVFLGGWGAGQMEKYVLTGQAGTQVTTPHYRLIDPPTDMGNDNLRAIGETFKVPGANFEDADLLAKVYERLDASPWVAKVNRVSKHIEPDSHRGVVVIDCEYRKPVARILLNPGQRTQTEAYLAADGVRLPVNQVPKYVVTAPDVNQRIVRRVYLDRASVSAGVPFALIHYPSIVGVRQSAPLVGEVWRGQDIADAIRLHHLLAGKSYYPQITKIDVSNHRARGDLVLHAGSTRVAFGKFPVDADDLHTVRPERKIAELDRYAAATGGQLSGVHPTIDVRHGRVTIGVD
jgi:hypothetical protein